MTEPRWLDEEELRIWRSLIAVSALVFERLNRDLEATASLSLADYEVLVLLADGERAGTGMTVLAQQALVSKSLITYTVQRLEDKGFVERLPHPSDGRGRLARLTPKGRRKLKTTAPAHVELVRTWVFDPLPKSQVRELGQALAAIEAAVREGRETAAL